ncbi:MAG: kynureninase [Armatimonas sp.]
MDFSAQAADFDKRDGLARFRERFPMPPGVIYLDGNSLGPVSRDAKRSLEQALSSWETNQIEGWTEGEAPWLFLPEQIGARLAPLVGANPDEVIATGSTTLNLHQLLSTLYDGSGPILLDANSFPTDRYAIQSHLTLRGLNPETHLRFVEPDEATIEAVLEQERIALAVLPSVVYTSGRLLDMARLTRAMQAQGGIVLWDLCHSIGALPHALSEIEADGAFWCSYKWLSAGPGAVGGLYLNSRHFERAPGIAGWFGAAKTLLFSGSHTLTPAQGAGRLQTGTTHVLSLAPLAGVLTLFEEAGITAIRAKSLALTSFLRECLAELAPELVCITPTTDNQRGGHLTLRHPQAAALSRALRARGVVGDHRPLDLLRLAPAPLFTSFVDCVEAAQRVRQALDSGLNLETDGGLVP